MRIGHKASAAHSARGCVATRAGKLAILTIIMAAIIVTPGMASAAKLSTSQLQRRVQQLESENEKLQKDIDDILAQASNSGNKSSSRNKALEYKKEIRAIEREKKELSKRIDELEGGLGENTEELAKTKQALAQAQQENESLKNGLAQLKAGQQELARLSDENNKLKQKIGELEAQNAQIEANLKAADPQRFSEMKNTLGEMQADNRKVAQALAQTQLENKSLKEKLEQKGAGQREFVRIQEENEGLKQKVGALEAQIAKAEANIKALNPGRFAEIQGSVSDLQEENRKLAQALAEMSTQALDAEKTRADQILASREAEDVKAQLAELQKSYTALEAKSRNQGVGSAELEKLKAQNESLRQTIHAQNEALLADDNAAKTNALLKQENANLKLAIQQRTEDQQASAEAIAALKEQISSMQKKTNQSGDSDSIRGLKQTVENLKAENERLTQAMSGVTPSIGGSETSKFGDRALLVKINDLQERLEKERTATSEYRKMIKQYQDQYGASGGNSAAPDQGNASVYAPEIRNLMIENQELRARLELLQSGGNTKSKSSNTPEDRGKQSTLDKEDEPFTNTQVILPTANELLETELQVKNVQLIRQNYKTLPEMPRATDIVGQGELSESVTRNLDGNSLPSLNDGASSEAMAEEGSADEEGRKLENYEPAAGEGAVRRQKPKRTPEKKEEIKTNG